MASAVVFAYHTVGVRCLSVLLARGIDVKLVVTHEDNPDENIWFENVATLAREHGIAVITPDDPNVADVVARVAACEPDFLFSFYYRQMLRAPLLQIPKRGAFNLHGSMLPQYRGRVPINWAVIRGASQTGATLHVMNEKPDNGPIVDQMAVPILPDDTARDVFEKVVVAGELVLHRVIPALVDGSARFTPQDLSQGGYFGGRKAEDGRIDWSQPAEAIHNLVRGVTRPYPGAFSDTPDGRLVVWRTQRSKGVAPGSPAIIVRRDQLMARCANGELLRVLEADFCGRRLDVERVLVEYGGELVL